MNHFDLAQSLIERCHKGAQSADLAAAFQRTLEILGFRYFACCSHVDPLRPPRGAVMLHSYPRPWARLFSELCFYTVDPVFQYANQTLCPFFWDRVPLTRHLTSLQWEILSEGRRFGIAHGYTVPIHLPGAPIALRASCSVVPDSPSVEAASYFMAHLMACYIYDALSRAAGTRVGRPVQPILSRRERQCLELVAQGKGDWEIGKILGLSERTVHSHIERAKHRLGVTTRVQAIVLALLGRQISFGDIIRAEPPGRT